MKGAHNPDDIKFISADGASYKLIRVRNRNTNNPTLGNAGQFIGAQGKVPHLTPRTSSNDGRSCSAIEIDIDGVNGPNRVGSDKFLFQMMDDGSLRPWGGSWEDENSRWTKTCPKSSNGTVTAPALCAGHVMENGLKVEYKTSRSSGSVGR